MSICLHFCLELLNAFSQGFKSQQYQLTFKNMICEVVARTHTHTFAYCTKSLLDVV